MTRRIALLFLSVALAGVAWAKPKDKDEDYNRLARISYIEGSVSYQHATDVDWAAASINLPLEPGDRIYTSSDARAEIEFDDGSVYRMARNTDVEILSLRDDLIQMRILVGLSSLVVADNTDFEMNTPAAAFNTLKKGSYRFQVEENGDSVAIVRKGKLEAANNDFSRRIQSGEMLRIALGSRANPEFARYDRRDDWDEWNDRRNADLNAYGSRKYLPDTVYIGVSDLHRHGRWVEVEHYGSAWIPYSVGISWSPYSVGRWCYRPIFGWTWVSYEPWGWLPYHYGRWYRSSAYGWCWLPGPSYSFNFWSPGLVAFYSGPSWISWCPLGPGDYYDVRHYHYNRGIYGHQINQLARLHTRERGDLFNRDAPHAFRTVPVDRFRNGSFGSRDRDPDYGQVDQPWRRGELVRDSLSIRPTATSYRAVPDRQAARPQTGRSLPAVVRNAPAYNTRGQEHYTRITNAQIPSIPSRAERMQSDREATATGVGARQTGRILQTPQREGSNSEIVPQARERATPGAQNPGVRGDTESSGRRMTTPRASQPDAQSPSARPSPSRERPEQAVPQQRQQSRPPAETQPNNENRRQNNSVEPRSRTTGGFRSEPPAVTDTPRTNGARTYYYRGSSDLTESAGSTRSYSGRTYSAPAQNLNEGRSAPRIERSEASDNRDVGTRSLTNRSYSAPTRSYSAPTYSAPSYSRSGRAGSSSIGRSGPSIEGNGGARSYSTPAPSRSSGGGNSIRSGGGMPRAQDRGRR